MGKRIIRGFTRRGRDQPKMRIASPSARIIRGFTRLGIGAAVLLILLINGAAARPLSVDDIPTIALLPLIVFVFFYGLGWIIAGFARE
jgi:hypothetical protein